MYNEYFGLTDSPFSIAPDPRYLYMSEQHREALAHLVFGMNTGGGFILLTGEVGTGKTTVCRCLLEQVPEDANVALVLNPKLVASELLATICDELGIQYPQGVTSIKTLVDCINRYLLDEHSRGRKTVVILEEAQNLDADVLEQLRLLTNLETNERKLLQIVMLGQPELLEILSTPEMRQFSQRITARYHLKALSRKEVHAYVAHRLSVAGLRGTLFSPSILNLLYRLSGGIPRRINLLCDRALLGVYVQNRNRVDRSILKKAAKEVLGEEDAFASFSRSFRMRVVRLFGLSLLWIVAPVVLIVLAMVGFGPYIENATVQIDNTVSTSLGAIPGKNVSDEFLLETPDHEKSLNLNEINSTDVTKNAGKDNSQPVLGQPHNTVLFDALPEGLLTATSLENAYRTLLETWKIGSTERVYDPCDYAGTRGLACLFKQGNMRSVISINRPAVLKLFDKNGQAYYVALISLQGDMATIVLDGNEYKVQVSELEENWLGDYTLIWKLPPGSDYGDIQFGDKGPLVLWLSNKLAQAGGDLSGLEQSDEFDTGLTEKIKVFQQSRGLFVDGLIGPVTLIHLNSVTDPEVPFLMSGEDGL